jgi:hypothetical protein
VERWRSDCGCRTTAGTSQAWRAPLRAATEWLAEELHAIYHAEARRYFSDPWEARTAYAVLGAPTDFAPAARELLELERNALRIFTSCGWFFDDVAGIETIQILRYAARAISLAGSDVARLEAGFLERLAHAHSNDRSRGSAADLYRRSAKPRWPPEERVAAGFATMAALCPGRSRWVVGSYLVGALGDNVVQTQHRRTGRVDRFATQVNRVPGFAVEIELARPGIGGSKSVGLEAIPEWEQTQAREVLRREALHEVLSAEDLVRLAHGSVEYSAALREAITRLVPASPAEVGPDTLSKLAQSLDLLELEALPIPFDAQTKLYRLIESSGDRLDPAIAKLGKRFGFSGAEGADEAAGADTAGQG